MLIIVTIMTGGGWNMLESTISFFLFSMSPDLCIASVNSALKVLARTGMGCRRSLVHRSSSTHHRSRYAGWMLASSSDTFICTRQYLHFEVDVMTASMSFQQQHKIAFSVPEQTGNTKTRIPREMGILHLVRKLEYISSKVCRSTARARVMHALLTRTGKAEAPLASLLSDPNPALSIQRSESGSSINMLGTSDTPEGSSIGGRIAWLDLLPNSVYQC